MPTVTSSTSNTPRTPSSNATKARRPQIIHDIDNSSNSNKKYGMLALIAILVIVAGIGTGFVLANLGSGSMGATSDADVASLPSGGTDTKAKQSAGEEGIDNDELFPDTATGELQANDGSISNEGTHMLIRDGGPDQTAFLFSSYVDLSKYEGKQVQIKGQTNTAQTAGWLLEVGWIKVVE